MSFDGYGDFCRRRASLLIRSQHWTALNVLGCSFPRWHDRGSSCDVPYSVACLKRCPCCCKRECSRPRCPVQGEEPLLFSVLRLTQNDRVKAESWPRHVLRPNASLHNGSTMSLCAQCRAGGGRDGRVWHDSGPTMVRAPLRTSCPSQLKGCRKGTSQPGPVFSRRGVCLEGALGKRDPLV